MKFITTAPDRRTLVKAIAAHTGMEPSYIGPPTFNYTVGTITIDREGYIDVPDEQAADLKAFLIAKGWMEPEPEPEQPRIQIGVPAKDLTVANVTNLIYMLYSKQYLLGKAIGTACVRIEDTVITRLQEYTPENLEAYAELLRDFKALGDLEGVELEEGQLRMDFPMAEDSTLWDAADDQDGRFRQGCAPRIPAAPAAGSRKVLHARVAAQDGVWRLRFQSCPAGAAQEPERVQRFP